MLSTYVMSDGCLKNRLDTNCLAGLPGSIAKLERLEELVLTNNVFAAFPEYLMELSSLKKVLGLILRPISSRCLIFGRDAWFAWQRHV